MEKDKKRISQKEKKKNRMKEKQLSKKNEKNEEKTKTEKVVVSKILIYASRLKCRR